MPNPFGRAVYDHQRGKQDEPLIQRDGEETVEHPIEMSILGEFHDWPARAEFLESWLEGPLIDMGAGAGRDTLYFQDQFETVAIDKSEYLVETMCERGVTDARCMDMFSLSENFERDRFQSALSFGTQLGLVGSMQDLRQFLNDLSFVTTENATAVLDSFDPNLEETSNIPGYREDSTPGLAYRVIHFEYGDDVGETLLFRLFSPDRLRDATDGTEWKVMEVKRALVEGEYHYHAALMKK